MIHIKCKKCGWREPFSTIKKGYTVKDRIIRKKIICPNCGHILISRNVKEK